jgi:hypothetical protein
MSTELESFAEYLQRRLMEGGTDQSPEQILSQWRANGGSEATNSLSSGTEETLFDRLTRKNLIGTIEGGPRDLSTNPKHMEGFGES